MTIQELAKLIEGNYILQMNDNAIQSKKDLYILLSIWKNTVGKTIGNLENDNINNTTQIIQLQCNNSSYYINADTTREGVLKFLDNKKNDWRIIKNEKGRRNKVTNTTNEDPIQGFYMYKVIN